MGMTITKKILARAAGMDSVETGQIIQVPVDSAMIHDNNGPIVLNQFERLDEKIWDTEKVVFVFDHHSPSTTKKAAIHQDRMRKFVKKNNIRSFYECGNGIAHYLLVENGHSMPGTIVVGTDSHTTGPGALGCFATGIGATEMAAVLAQGKVWFKVPETIRIELQGTFPEMVDGKDLVLWILGKLGPNGANYKAVEFVGSGVSNLTIEDRVTVSVMCMEMGCKNAIFQPDKIVVDYLAARGYETGDISWIYSEEDAQYSLEMKIDLGDIEPGIAKPHFPANYSSIDEIGTQVVHQAAIGSCAGGSIIDLRRAAAILNGRKVHPDVRTIVVPASREIYLQAVKEGLIGIFMEAGAIVSSPACGPCGAHDIGAIAADEVCVATTTRNLPGRMGKGGIIYLASSSTVAASSVAGYIVDPRTIEEVSK